MEAALQVGMFQYLSREEESMLNGGASYRTIAWATQCLYFSPMVAVANPLAGAALALGGAGLFALGMK